MIGALAQPTGLHFRNVYVAGTGREIVGQPHATEAEAKRVAAVFMAEAKAEGWRHVGVQTVRPNKH